MFPDVERSARPLATDPPLAFAREAWQPPPEAQECGQWQRQGLEAGHSRARRAGRKRIAEVRQRTTDGAAHLLQQQAPVGREQEDREGAVQHALVDVLHEVRCGPRGSGGAGRCRGKIEPNGPGAQRGLLAARPLPCGVRRAMRSPSGTRHRVAGAGKAARAPPSKLRRPPRGWRHRGRRRGGVETRGLALPVRLLANSNGASQSFLEAAPTTLSSSSTKMTRSSIILIWSASAPSNTACGSGAGARSSADLVWQASAQSYRPARFACPRAGTPPRSAHVTRLVGSHPSASLLRKGHEWAPPGGGAHKVGLDRRRAEVRAAERAMAAVAVRAEARGECIGASDCVPESRGSVAAQPAAARCGHSSRATSHTAMRPSLSPVANLADLPRGPAPTDKL